MLNNETLTKKITDLDLQIQDALEQNILGKEEFDLAYKTLNRVQEKYSTQTDVNNLRINIGKT